MISTKEKIGTSQMITLLISTILGVGILSLPRNLADKVQGSGFIIIIISTVICIFFGYCMYKVIYGFRNKSLMQISSDILTKPMAYLVCIIFILYYLVNISMVVRIFGEVVKMYMLEKTPIEVIIISILFVCAYSSKKGIEGIARISQIILFLMVVPIIFVFFFSLETADFTNLMPILNVKASQVFPTVFLTTFAFSGFETMLVLSIFMREPKDGFKIQWITLIVIGIVYIFFSVISIAVFGQVETTHLMWPTLTIVKVIDIPGAFLENLDALIMGTWTLNIFITLCVFLFCASLVIGDMFNCREINYFDYAIVPVVYILAMYPDNLAHVYDLLNSKYTVAVQLMVFAGIPLILFLFSRFSKKVKKA
ncbi:GerAB/ArcD/ProY family transporter [Tepidibacter hydrothermalis]|uniref:Endospore germination permease n=1 Tax=Tepidibacter hydrothermalis TaxID=3036126 RepID=A0ABY8EH12_9FIRM|nr:endospore germination permease [Tepidibacter hydrothermalis]WFD10125.1 endospore germination permease [Tepidibacter hydrothermalis]